MVADFPDPECGFNLIFSDIPFYVISTNLKALGRKLAAGDTPCGYRYAGMVIPSKVLLP